MSEILNKQKGSNSPFLTVVIHRYLGWTCWTYAIVGLLL